MSWEEKLSQLFLLKMSSRNINLTFALHFHFLAAIPPASFTSIDSLEVPPHSFPCCLYSLITLLFLSLCCCPLSAILSISVAFCPIPGPEFTSPPSLVTLVKVLPFIPSITIRCPILKSSLPSFKNCVSFLSAGCIISYYPTYITA